MEKQYIKENKAKEDRRALQLTGQSTLTEQDSACCLTFRIRIYPLGQKWGQAHNRTMHVNNYH